jgi:hypothetical protein
MNGAQKYLHSQHANEHVENPQDNPELMHTPVEHIQVFSIVVTQVFSIVHDPFKHTTRRR